MIERIDVRLEKGKAVIETGINEALDLLYLALERGLIESEGKAAAIFGRREEEKRVEERREKEEHSIANFFDSSERDEEIEKRIYEPTLNEVREYILSKAPTFEHSMPELTKHYFGRRLFATGPEYKAFNRLYHKIKEVRNEIKRTHNGQWFKYGASPRNEKQYICFRFISNGDTTKQADSVAGEEIKEESTPREIKLVV